MAGTPTTNYNIPTYADTDAPDLSGAYNDAMGIIDTQLKANADAIAEAGGTEYTGSNGISVSGGTISGIEQNSVSVVEDAVTGDPGVVRYAGTKEVMQQVLDLNGQDMYKVQPSVRAVADYVAAHGGTAYTGTAPIIVNKNNISIKGAGSAENDEGTVTYGTPGTTVIAGNNVVLEAVANDSTGGNRVITVPNCFAVKTYVESKMASAGVAYTGTAPVVVDNGSHTISVNGAGYANPTPTYVPATMGTVGLASTVDALIAVANDASSGDVDKSASERTAPNCYAVRAYVMSRTPDASTSVKGLVKLDTGGTNTENSTDAITARGVVSLMGTLRNNVTSRVTVNDLANNLYYSTATGMLFYKPAA